MDCLHSMTIFHFSSADCGRYGQHGCLGGLGTQFSRRCPCQEVAVEERFQKQQQRQQQQQQQQQQLYNSITISIHGVTYKIKVNNKQ